MERICLRCLATGLAAAAAVQAIALAAVGSPTLESALLDVLQRVAVLLGVPPVVW